MVEVCWIAQVDIDDVEHYELCVAAIAEPLRKHGARFLVRNTSQYQLVEGSSRQRPALSEFPFHHAVMELRAPEPVDEARETAQF